MKVYSPEGAVGQAAQQTAPSPSSLAGLRLAVLDNGKPGARRILERAAERLEQRAKTQSVGVFRKRTAATPCEAAVLDEICEAADLVLTAVAD